MTGYRPPEDGEAESTRFVDPLTGRPLPTPPDAEPQGPPLASPIDVAPPVLGFGRRVLDNPLRVGLVGAGALVLVAFLVIVVIIGQFSEFANTAGVGVSTRGPASVSPAGKRAPVAPSIEGWQAVVSDNQPFAFDVPASWTVEDPSVGVGFETSNGELLAMHGVARFKSNFCPVLDISSRAQAGFTTIDTDEVSDIREAAKESIVRWADAALSSADGGQEPQVEVTSSQPVRVFAGAVEAARVTATVRAAEPNECSPPSVSITAVALPLWVGSSDGHYHVHLVLSDQEVADSVPADVTTKIIGSIRPAG